MSDSQDEARKLAEEIRYIWKENHSEFGCPSVQGRVVAMIHAALEKVVREDAAVSEKWARAEGNRGVEGVILRHWGLK